MAEATIVPENSSVPLSNNSLHDADTNISDVCLSFFIIISKYHSAF